MKKKTILKQRISEECWDLDFAFYKWLNFRLKVYLREAEKVVDLNYHTFSYKNNSYTQKEVIERMIVLSNKLIEGSNIDDNYITNSDELLDLWKLVIHHMWW